MLTSRSVPRPVFLQHAIVTNNALGSPGTSSLRSRYHLQTRTFRLGMWPFYADHISCREIRRRNRALKHKYTDAINQRLTWYGDALAEDPHQAMKRVVTKYWASTTSGDSSQWINKDEWPNQHKYDSRRARSRCDSGETSSLDSRSKRSDVWKTEVDENPSDQPQQAANMKTRNETGAHLKKSRSHEKNKRERNSTVEPDYFIDPITNRKVPQRDPEFVELGLESLPQTIKVYRSQFGSFVAPNADQECPPIHPNGVPPVSELSNYADPKFDDRTVTEIQSQTDSGKPSGQLEASHFVFDSSALKSEEYALNHLPLDDPIEEDGDAHNCQTSCPVTEKASRNADSHVSPSTAEISKDNEDASSSQHTLESGSLQSELERYERYIFEDPTHEGDTSKQSNDLDQYRPTSFDDIKDEDQPFQQYGDLEKYRAMTYQDFNTASTFEHDITSESLREYETKEQNDSVSGVIDTHSSSVSGKLPKMELPEGHIFYKHHTGENVGDVARSLRNGDKSREKLQQCMEDLSKSSDAIDREVNLNLQKMRQNSDNHQSLSHPQIFTENFVRDFPEEFQQSWNVRQGGLLPGTDHSRPLDSPSGQELRKSGSDRRRPSFKLEPALNRRASATKGRRISSALGADLYSKEPQGLETSFAEECGGRQTMPLYTRTYGSEPGQVPARSKPAVEAQESRLKPSTDSYYDRDPEIDGIPPSGPKEPKQDHKAVQPEEPTLYKILVYDTDTQTVSVVETTSVVPDQTSPLTPTDVLPRLSHPAKFLPHFAPLQAEGFEIVSGNGDVLVFRQVRLAKAADRGGSGPLVNPIDMMGRPPAAALPNAAAFVSPTGFVNYDVPRVEEEEPSAETEPTFQSNINVRREEPVFSGPKTDGNRKDGKKSKKMGVGKRVLIGGVWVAGISYALGVITEYFVTGGSDGTGPTGI